MAQLAEFRRLRGVGPAAEARLHHAGVGTWADLAQVLAVLAKAAPRYDGLADLARAVVDQVDLADHDPAPPSAHEPIGPGETAAASETAEVTLATTLGQAPQAFAVDAGLAIGGAARDVVVRLEPLASGAGAQSYRADLVGRQLGASGGDTWQPLGARQIRAGSDGGHPATLRFEGVPVPAGIHRLQLHLTPQPH
jgi:hypothetical protein